MNSHEEYGSGLQILRLLNQLSLVQHVAKKLGGFEVRVYPSVILHYSTFSHTLSLSISLSTVNNKLLSNNKNQQSKTNFYSLEYSTKLYTLKVHYLFFHGPFKKNSTLDEFLNFQGKNKKFFPAKFVKHEFQNTLDWKGFVS